MTDIDVQARAVLGRATIGQDRIVLPAEELPRELYRHVDLVLNRLGAKWDRRERAHLFLGSGFREAELKDYVAGGTVPANKRRTTGFVATPPEVAEDVARLALIAELPPQARVLEPSAGTGALVGAVLAAGPDVQVTAVESDPVLAEHIDTRHGQVTVEVGRFEDHAGSGYHAVVMNPPWSVGAGRVWDKHVLNAYHRLAPGGLLVAIVPASVIRAPLGAAGHELATLIRQRGGLRPVDPADFPDSPRCTLLWLAGEAAPLPDPTTPPVEVDHIRTHPAAAWDTPVQAWRDAWRGGRLRTLRFTGECLVCHLPTWSFDDGENDPRGALGDRTSAPLVASDQYQVGPDVPLCALCANDYDAYQQAIQFSETVWTAEPETES